MEDHWLQEYLESENFRLFYYGSKSLAEPVLAAFFKSVQERGNRSLIEISPGLVQAVLLEDLIRVQVSGEDKKEIPRVLENFFIFLDESGRLPGKQSIIERIRSCGHQYQERIRQDGSVKGVTYRKKGSEVGRNDPCPCGSGKKYKKCCASLFEV